MTRPRLVLAGSGGFWANHLAPGRRWLAPCVTRPNLTWQPGRRSICWAPQPMGCNEPALPCHPHQPQPPIYGHFADRRKLPGADRVIGGRPDGRTLPTRCIPRAMVQQADFPEQAAVVSGGAWILSGPSAEDGRWGLALDVLSPRAKFAHLDLPSKPSSSQLTQAIRLTYAEAPSAELVQEFIHLYPGHVSGP
jgi:hypothetical protein